MKDFWHLASFLLVTAFGTASCGDCTRQAHIMDSTRSTCALSPASLADVLEQAASSMHGLIIYDDQEDTCARMSYRELLGIAQRKSQWILGLPNARRGIVVLLHLSKFQETLEWFWAVVFAGLLPVVSTPLPHETDRRRVHLSHVRDVLNQPIVLISRNLVGELENVENIDLTIAEEKRSIEASAKRKCLKGVPRETDPAALMLTSGSSGNAKAVVLHHKQITASVRGKSKFFGTSHADIFLNWIGFDHVASLIETHIHAMYLGAEFIHVPAPVLLVDPIRFIQLIDQHRVTYAFAPHFFLARLVQTLGNTSVSQKLFDISCLRHLISGGELNVVETIVTFTKVLQQHKLKGDVVKPGFGMTETCAGSIYGVNCPSYDLSKGNAFASLGKPIPGMRLRVVDATGDELSPGEIGDLQVTGEQVFQEYFNNKEATISSFTKDGWFNTGDRAYLDSTGYLNIAGRDKETLNLNGVKYFPHEIESALDRSKISGLTPSWNVVFPCRPPGSLVEEICVVYLPTFGAEEVPERVETAREIVFLVASITNARPKHIIPLPEKHLHKSALGKLSRAKIRTAFEEGKYEQYEDSKHPAIRRYKARQRDIPASTTEHIIMSALQDLFEITEELGVNSSVFDFGVTSTGLFTLKRRIERDLALAISVPVGVFLTTPTIRGIAGELDRLDQDAKDVYDPVVPLRTNSASAKTPLWLVHPGSGDVLVFVNLARYFSERDVYGLRTRGLYTGLEEANYFTSIEEIAETYVKSIKRYQPNGPYAIAGYSLGSTVAFEISKLLESAGDEVAFLGLFDSPPHMRELIEELEWTDVLVNVAYFLELISEDFSNSIITDLHRYSSDHALDAIMSHAPRHRLETLAIDKTRLHKLTDVTNAFGVAGKKYNPTGSVKCADVFWVTPLLSVSPSRQQWMDEHLVRWKEFVVEAPRFHECAGVHSKMLNSEHVDSFQETLKLAMAARGV